MLKSQLYLTYPSGSFNLPSHLVFRLLAFIFTDHVVIPFTVSIKLPAQNSGPCPRRKSHKGESLGYLSLGGVEAQGERIKTRVLKSQEGRGVGRWQIN